MKSQAGYFNIILPKYFSDQLCSEWEDIVRDIKLKNSWRDEDGRVILGAVPHTFGQMMSLHECQWDGGTNHKAL
ncbi:hypothetical protein Dfri01_23190 [Dyadobacter frigoris]|nr:hypothetical protein Dfri01_23190 [Dyadobacter frigoris]